MKTIFEIIAALASSYAFAGFLVPAIGKLAGRLNLIDKPNYRKVHTTPVPLIGGIIIAFSSCMALLINPQLSNILFFYMPMVGCLTALLIMGVIDDKFDLKAKYKLLIQLACAYTIASSGIRITSLHGVMGIYEIADWAQYALTIVLITGVVNAFNLMDGIDGLAGGLSALGFLLFVVLGILTSNYTLAVISASMLGGLFVFLKHNLSSKKIFLGDAGSLTMGFMLVTFGIQSIESAGKQDLLNNSLIMVIIVAFFTIPTFDSLRVYWGRIKNGNSPFKADKSHIHHILLYLGFKHKTTSMAIILFVATLLIIVSGLNHFLSTTIALFGSAFLFLFLARLLGRIQQFKQWMSRLDKLEKNENPIL